MNIQQYINSGIIEAYWLGLATKDEQEEFETFSLQHPLLLQVLSAFEESLEQHAMGAPDRGFVKTKLLEALAEASPLSIDQLWRIAWKPELMDSMGSYQFEN